MQRLLVLAALLALCIGARANTCVPLQAGAVDQSVYVEFIDSTTGVPNAGLAFNSSGIDLEYVRSGAAAVDITEATQTASGAHSDGGFVSVGHGRYRLDLPDAAVATGVPQVVVQGTITGYILLPCVVALSPPANVTAWNSTALSTTNPLPNAAGGASGGLLISGSNSGTTTLGALTITGTTTLSDGLLVNRSTGNASAIVATGNGTGDGARFVSGSGATGAGLVAVASATNGPGISSTGAGGAPGALFTGGSTGNGANFLSGTGATGSGVAMTAQSTNGNGLLLTATGTGVGVSGSGLATSAALQIVDDFVDDIGVAGAGLTNIDLPNQTMDITGTLSTVTTVTNIVTANATQISGDSAAADALELAFDGTATGARLFGIDRLGTAAAVAAGTLTMDAGAAYGDNTLTGATVWGCGSTQGYCQFNSVASNVGSTDVLTLSSNWAVTPSGTVTFYLFGTSAASGDVNVTTIEGTDATTVLGTAQTGDAFARLGAPAGASVSADIAAVKSDTAATLTDTAEIGTAGAGLTNINLPNQTMDITGNITGNVSGSVGSVTGAVGSVTGAVGSVTGNVGGNVVGSVGSVVNLEQVALADAAVINCTVNTAFFAGSTTTVACILTDRDGGAITAASNDLEGRELLILSGAQIYEGRFINDTTWDGANSELQLTLSRALPGTLADAVTAIIR